MLGQEAEELRETEIAKAGTIRQILLITDGCSNVGDDPVQIAAEARRAGVVVNVIGVVDRGDLGRQGKEEALSIADAGGGMCRVVQPAELSATAQMMTHQTMQMTLQQVVNQELLQAMGKTSEELEPNERARVAQVIDKLEETLRLELVVAVDTSASMKDKMPLVREALRDLSLSLQAREGEGLVAVIRFPGKKESADVVHGFSTDFEVDSISNVLVARGGTPTGPALQEALQLFTQQRMGQDRREPWSDPVNDLPEHRWDGTSSWSS